MNSLDQVLTRLELLRETRAIETPEVVTSTGRRLAVRCEVCNDRGWTTAGDEGAGTAVRCACQLPPHDGDRLRAKLAAIGFEAREIDAAWTPWDDRHQPRPEWARAWLAWVLTGAVGDPPEGVQGGRRSPWCLSLVGAPGCGKTKTAATLTRIYVSQGGDGAIWARVPELYDRVMRERAEFGWSDFERRAEQAWFLVLDEAGREHRRRRESERESAIDQLIGEVLMRRHRRELLTILTANLRIQELGDGAVESRIREGCWREMGSKLGDFRDWKP